MKINTENFDNFLIQQDVKSFFKAALLHYQKKNPHFSQTAFARKMKIAPSSLSEVMSGKKFLSLEKALEIGQNLKMDVKYITHLCQLVALESCTDPGQKEKLQQEINQRKKVERVHFENDRFHLISRWECVAVLELIGVYPNNNILFYAKKLSLSEDLVKDAFRDLVESGLIEKIDSGYIRKLSDTVVSSESHHLALKIFHSQMLEKAKNALFRQGPDTRYTGTETLMIDSKKLPAAKEIMDECLNRLLNLFNSSSDKDSLVHIQVNLFSLTTDNKNEKSA